MQLLIQLARYCERAGDAGLTAEPLNALSNLGFLVAAILAAARLRKAGTGGPAEWALAALTATVGLGSLAFHTLATPWAMAADVLPIAVFVLSYAVLAMRRLLRFGWPAVCASLLAVAAVEAALVPLRCDGAPCLNGSLPYLPALGLLAGAAALAARSNRAVAMRLWLAALLFALAILVRTLDHTLCDALTVFGKPRGTHALWHLLNAVTLYVLLDTAIVTAPGQIRHCAGRRHPS